MERRVKLRQSSVVGQEMGYDRIADPPTYSACSEDLRPYPKASRRHLLGGCRDCDQVSHRPGTIRSCAPDLASEEARTVWQNILAILESERSDHPAGGAGVQPHCKRFTFGLPEGPRRQRQGED